MKKNILFVCTGNLCRSVIGEGILKKKLADRKIDSVTVSSAGTFALNARPAADLAVRVASERGVDLSGHRTRHVTRELLESADMVICAETDHVVESGVVLADKSGKYRLLSDFGPPHLRGHDIEDPYGAPIDYFVSAYDRIEECVDGLLLDLLR